jgi:hypothetical protein
LPSATQACPWGFLPLGLPSASLPNHFNTLLA